MPDHVCSLLTTEPQTIPPGSTGYTVVRFPYGVAESWDPDDMHPLAQPDGGFATYADPRSGLIWPAHDAWARLDAMLQWEEGPYSEVRDQFVRDPLGLTSSGPNTTCTEDHPPTPGGQYIAKSWPLFVHPGMPVAVAVRHNSNRPLRLLFAELKLSYHRDPEPVAA